MKALTLFLPLFLALLLVSCGDDEDDELNETLKAIQQDIQAIQQDIDLLKEQVGIDTSKPDDALQPTDEQFPIVYESDGEIYAIKPDGSELKNLTNHSAYDTEPAWSPDGKTIAFVSDEGWRTIYLMNADGSHRRLFADVRHHIHDHSRRPHLSKPTFSAGKNMFMFGTLFNTGHGISYNLYFGGNPEPTHFRRGIYPTLSPIGQIVYVDYTDDIQEDIYFMNARNDSPLRITDNIGSDTHPAWSPDGTRIAFASSASHNDGRVKYDTRSLLQGKTIFDIFVMNPDGTGKINLTQHPGDDRWPAWSPDSRQIAFMSNRNGSFNWEIYVMNADGTNQRNITNNLIADDKYPNWRPYPRNREGYRL